MENPYQSPNAAVVAQRQKTPRLDDLASGQKLVIYAILLYFAAAALRTGLGTAVALLPLLACIGMSWVGIYRITRGLDYPMWVRILLLIVMLVPLIGLLLLVFLSSRATKQLEQAGYSVGLLGARDY